MYLILLSIWETVCGVKYLVLYVARIVMSPRFCGLLLSSLSLLLLLLPSPHLVVNHLLLPLQLSLSPLSKNFILHYYPFRHLRLRDSLSSWALRYVFSSLPLHSVLPLTCHRHRIPNSHSPPHLPGTLLPRVYRDVTPANTRFPNVA